MKKFTIFATLAMVALAAISCNKNEEPKPQPEQKVISVSTSLYSFTKATDTAFESGDAIGVHIISNQPNEPYLNNAKYTYNGTAWKGEQTNYWYKDESVVADIYAYYPYSANGGYNATGINFTVNSDQTTHAGYTASDLMLAQASSKPTAEAVKLGFKHALSKVVVNINSELDEAIADVMFSDVYGTANVSLAGGAATVGGSKGGIKALKVKDTQWQLILVPQENVTPKLIVTTTAQKQYTFDIESAVSFAAGKVSTTTISLTKESISTSFTTEVTDWTADKELNFSQSGSQDVIIPSGGDTLYLDPNIWSSDSPWFAAYFWADNVDAIWVKMADEDGDGIYACEIPEGVSKVIFTRMNPAYSELGWNSDTVKDLVWNQTVNLTFEGNLFTVNEWDVDGKSTGSWDTLYSVD